MAQYSTGTVTTDGTSVITGDSTLWLTASITNSYSFIIPLTAGGDGVLYDIASVDSETQITLTSAYGGSDVSGVVYGVQRDFTTPDNIPELTNGDVGVAAIFTRAMRTIQTLIANTASRVQTLTNKTIDLTDNTLTGTLAEFNTAISDDDVFGVSELTLAVGNIANPDVDLFAGKYSDSLTVTNATPATARTYVDPYGVVQYADPDTIRVEKEGWLIEGSSENLAIRSEEFDTASWIKIGLLTVSANSWTAPDNNVTGDTLTEDTSTNFHYITQNISHSASATVTGSVFIGSGSTETVVRVQLWNATDGSIALCTFNPSTGVIASGTGGYAVVAVNGGWRVSVSGATTTTSSSIRIFFNNGTSYTGDGVTTIQVWGAQLEEQPFATSYIPTTTVAVTRQADSTKIPYYDNINLSGEFTIVADVTIPAFRDTTDNRFLVSYSYSLVHGYLNIKDTGVITAAVLNGGVITSTTVLNPEQTYRVILTSDGTNFQLYIDGILESSSTVGAATPVITQNILFGDNLSGKYDKLRIYHNHFSATEAALA